MTDDAFLSKVVDWASAQPDITALILTGSRARPGGAVDSFSDYDLEIFTTDPERYTSNSEWHIPKYIHRNDLWVVKHRDWTMKELLLRMLEWHAAAAGTSDIAYIGVHMKDWTRPDIWKRLHEAFGRFDAADSRRALLETISLFRDVAKETSSMLGYSYPQHADQAISGYITGLLDSLDS